MLCPGPSVQASGIEGRSTQAALHIVSSSTYGLPTDQEALLESRRGSSSSLRNML